MILSIFYIFLKNSYFFADVNVTRVIHSRSLLKKSNVICLFFLEQIAHLLSKTPCSSLLFPFLSPFMPKNESLLSLFALLLFLKSNRSESLSSLFKKDKRVTWNKLLPLLFKKERQEWFALWK